MQLAKYKKKGIFCIESDWTNNLRDKASIKTALDFLDLNAGIKSIHRHCSTPEELQSRLKDYSYKKYDKFSILYLACHGSRSQLHIGKRKKVDLDELAEMIDGTANKKIIHFGSCETLDLTRPEIKRFMRKTNALAISGYTKKINFIDSTLLDVLFFEACQHYHKMELIENLMKANHSGMMKQNGFKIVYDR